MKFFATPTTANELYVKADDSIPDSIVLMVGKDTFVIADLETEKIKHFSKASLERIVKYAKRFEDKIAPLTVDIAEMILRHEKEKETK